MRKVIYSCLLVCVVTIFAGCGGGGGGGGTPGPSYTPIVTPEFNKTFSGSTAQVLETFELPVGLYKITVQTDGFFQLFYEGNRQSIFNLSSGEGFGAETVLKSHGGNYVFRTDNISKPWTLTFSNIDFSNPAQILEINNVMSSVPKVLGPYQIANKTYKITMYTDGYFQLFPIDPETGSEGYSIFNESAGSWGTSTTYTPDHDLVLFRTDNISAVWSIYFEEM